jgi:hypothetical protein
MTMSITERFQHRPRLPAIQKENRPFVETKDRLHLLEWLKMQVFYTLLCWPEAQLKRFDLNCQR